LNTVSQPTTRAADLTPYMHYAHIIQDDATQMNGEGDVTLYTCEAVQPCLRFHNGSLIRAGNSSFSGTSNLHAVTFILDVDDRPRVLALPFRTNRHPKNHRTRNDKQLRGRLEPFQLAGARLVQMELTAST
jgi:hypothetical protein